ncbi:MAG: hypothetical protein NTW49_02415 [Bacteroidia bacterium]|nr:hypothetical protein [Bacteroidia bacterium]
MRKTSTLVYLVNNFECYQNLLLTADEFVSDDFSEYSDVFELLDKVNPEPSAESVRKIVDFARNFH